MNTDKTATTQDNHENYCAGQVSDNTFREICTANAIDERMDIIMDIFKEVVGCRPYGTEKDIENWNTFLMQVSADLAVIRMRSMMAVQRVKYDCGAMSKEEFMDRCDTIRDDNCIVCAMMETKEKSLGVTPIMEEPEEGSQQAPADDSDEEYRIQED